MPKFEKGEKDQETKKSSSEKKEKTEKPVTTAEVVKAQQDIILTNKNGLYSYKDKKTGAYYDVTIGGNNIVLHKHYNAEITQLFKGELNKTQLTVTLDKLGTGIIDRTDGSYSGSKEGLKAAKKQLEDCKKYIKFATEQKKAKKEVASLEQDLNNAYA